MPSGKLLTTFAIEEYFFIKIIFIFMLKDMLIFPNERHSYNSYSKNIKVRDHLPNPFHDTEFNTIVFA